MADNLLTLEEHAMALEMEWFDWLSEAWRNREIDPPSIDEEKSLLMFAPKMDGRDVTYFLRVIDREVREAVLVQRLDDFDGVANVRLSVVVSPTARRRGFGRGVVNDVLRVLWEAATRSGTRQVFVELIVEDGDHAGTGLATAVFGVSSVEGLHPETNAPSRLYLRRLSELQT